jgi:hypothetical protein
LFLMIAIPWWLNMWNIFSYIFISHLQYFWELSNLSIYQLSYLLFCCLAFWVLYISWILIPCQMNSTQISSHFIGCLFNVLIVFFAMQKLFNLIQSRLSILAIFPELLESSSESLCLCLYLKVLCFPLVVSKF